MQTKTVRTPIQIQLLFLLIIAIGAIGFLFSYQYTSATTITRNYCDKIYYDTFVGEFHPEYNKICKNRFQYLTNQLKRSFINNHK